MHFLKNISDKASYMAILGFVYLAGWSPVRADSDLKINIKLDNPINVNTVPEFILKVVDIVKIIAIPVITFFIIYSGFLFVTAQGNKEQLSKAKKSILWTVVGTAIILGASILANAIQGTIVQLK